AADRREDRQAGRQHGTDPGHLTLMRAWTTLRFPSIAPRLTTLRFPSIAPRLTTLRFPSIAPRLTTLRFPSIAPRFLLLSCLLGASVAFAAGAEPVDGPAPLVDAAHAGNDAQALELLAAKPGADANQKSSDGTTALHWAVYRNDVGLIDRLLAAGANPNARNDYGSTPLALAAVVGNVEVIKKLLK